MSPTVLRVAALSVAALLMATGCGGTRLEAKPPSPQPSGDYSETTDDDEQGPAKDDEQGPAAYVEICVRKTSLVRAEYQPCDDEVQGYTWYFVPMTAKVPAVGKRPGTGMSVEPFGVDYRAPRRGGKGRRVMTFLNQDVIQICVKKRTRTRVPDAHCVADEKGYAWYYLLLSRQIPAVGLMAVNGSFRSSEYSATFRARPGGGKGRKVAFKPRDEVSEEPEDKKTKSTRPTTGSTRPPASTRPSTASTRPPAKHCTTTRTGKVTTRRCS